MKYSGVAPQRHPSGPPPHRSRELKIEDEDEREDENAYRICARTRAIVGGS